MRARPARRRRRRRPQRCRGRRRRRGRTTARAGLLKESRPHPCPRRARARSETLRAPPDPAPSLCRGARPTPALAPPPSLSLSLTRSRALHSFSCCLQHTRAHCCALPPLFPPVPIGRTNLLCPRCAPSGAAASSPVSTPPPPAPAPSGVHKGGAPCNCRPPATATITNARRRYLASRDARADSDRLHRPRERIRLRWFRRATAHTKSGRQNAFLSVAPPRHWNQAEGRLMHAP